MVPAIFVLIAASPPLAGVVHHGHVDGDTIVWRSRFGFAQHADKPVVVALAQPLPAEAEVDESWPGAAVAVRGPDDRVVALSVQPAGLAVVRVRLAREGAVVLAPPLPDAPVPVKIVLELDETVFEPAPRHRLERYLGYWATVDAAERARGSLDQLDDLGSSRVSDHVYYFASTSDLLPAGGLGGKLAPAPHRTVEAAISIGLVFVLCVAGLTIAYRRAGRQAERDRAERMLEARFEELG